MRTKRSSPLKYKPLRNPGQSLDQAINDLIAERFFPYYVIPAVLWLIAGIEYIASVVGMPRLPGIYAIAAALLSAVGGVRFWRLRSNVRALKQGRDGERAVGQFLEGLREHGARIFHDIPGEGFNVDHVVISANGIFAVETKTLSKRSPQSVITIDGEKVLVAGHPMKRDPVKQVRAQVAWLSRLMEETTGKKLPVKGAIVFPGWFVEPSKDARQLDVWVLEPKALPAFIAHEPVKLAAEDVSLAAFHLSRYIRTT